MIRDTLTCWRLDVSRPRRLPSSPEARNRRGPRTRHSPSHHQDLSSILAVNDVPPPITVTTTTTLLPSDCDDYTVDLTISLLLTLRSSSPSHVKVTLPPYSPQPKPVKLLSGVPLPLPTVATVAGSTTVRSCCDPYHKLRNPSPTLFLGAFVCLPKTPTVTLALAFSRMARVSKVMFPSRCQSIIITNAIECC